LKQEKQRKSTHPCSGGEGREDASFAVECWEMLAWATEIERKYGWLMLDPRVGWGYHYKEKNPSSTTFPVPPNTRVSVLIAGWNYQGSLKNTDSQTPFSRDSFSWFGVGSGLPHFFQVCKDEIQQSTNASHPCLCPMYENTCPSSNVKLLYWGISFFMLKRGCCAKVW
jgi:hypothetical protein